MGLVDGEGADIDALEELVEVVPTNRSGETNSNRTAPWRMSCS